jgi:hypothetical protein
MGSRIRGSGIIEWGISNAVGESPPPPPASVAPPSRVLEASHTRLRGRGCGDPIRGMKGLLYSLPECLSKDSPTELLIPQSIIPEPLILEPINSRTYNGTEPLMPEPIMRLNL